MRAGAKPAAVGDGAQRRVCEAVRQHGRAGSVVWALHRRRGKNSPTPVVFQADGAKGGECACVALTRPGRRQPEKRQRSAAGSPGHMGWFRPFDAPDL